MNRPTLSETHQGNVSFRSGGKRLIGSRFIWRATASLHDRRTSAENDYRSIRVGMAGETTFSTGKPGLALAGRFVDGSTRRTRLAGVRRIDLDKGAAAGFQLITQLGFKAAPSLGEDRSIEPALSLSSSGHVGCVQIFKSDVSETARNDRAGVVLPVCTNTRYFSGYAGQPLPLLQVTIGATLATSEYALSLSFAPLQCRDVGCGHHLAVGQRQRVRHAPINADRGQAIGRSIVFNFAGERDMPAQRIFRECGGDDVSYQWPRQTKPNHSDFRNTNTRPSSPLSAETYFSAGMAEAHMAPLGLKAWVLGASREEARERAIEITDRLLQRRDMHSGQPRQICFQFGDLRTLRGKVKRSARSSAKLPPERASLLKGEIVNEAACVGRGLHKRGLFLSRIKPVPERSLNHDLFYQPRKGPTMPNRHSSGDAFGPRCDPFGAQPPAASSCQHRIAIAGERK